MRTLRSRGDVAANQISGIRLAIDDFGTDILR